MQYYKVITRLEKWLGRWFWQPCSLAAMQLSFNMLYIPSCTSAPGLDKLISSGISTGLLLYQGFVTVDFAVFVRSDHLFRWFQGLKTVFENFCCGRSMTQHFHRQPLIMCCFQANWSLEVSRPSHITKRCRSVICHLSSFPGRWNLNIFFNRWQ